MNGMRILFIHDGGGGGAGVYVDLLARLLREREHEVETFAGPDRPGPLSLIHRFYDPTAAAAVARMIREFKPDLVHAHNLLRALSPAPVLAAARAGVPVALTVHDPQLLCPKTWLVDRTGGLCASAMGKRCFTTGCLPLARYPVYAKVALARKLLDGRVAALAAPSAFLATNLRKHWAPAPVFVLRPPVDPWTFPYESSREGRNVLYAGRLDPEKGVQVLLPAFARVAARFPDARLVLAGEGRSGPGLRRLARDLGLGERVRFLGEVPRASMPALYRGARVAVVPSLWAEAFGQVGIEAMACGTPVVASAIGGIPEWCKHGQNGLLVPPGDAPALGDAIARILGDPGAAEAMGRAGREAAERLFDPNDHAEAVEAMYGAVLRKAPARTASRRLPAKLRPLAGLGGAR